MNPNEVSKDLEQAKHDSDKLSKSMTYDQDGFKDERIRDSSVMYGETKDTARNYTKEIENIRQSSVIHFEKIEDDVLEGYKSKPDDNEYSSNMRLSQSNTEILKMRNDSNFS